MSERPDIKKKCFRLKIGLAYELEIHAKKQHTTEVELVSRYIEDGLRRDKGQTTLNIEK